MAEQTTKCPNCQTVFRISDEQLEKAEGTVRCSQCNEIFNAGAFLSTTGSTESGDTSEGFTNIFGDIQEDSPNFSIPDELAEEPQESDELSDIINALKEEKQEQEGAKKPPLAKDVFGDDLSEERVENKAEGEDKEIPTALEEDIVTQQTPKKKTHPILWGFCTLILISTLALQYAYFSREKLALDPRFRPWLITMCEYLQCNISYKKDVSSIHLLSRDVLIAPANNKDALIIQLSFVNKASHIQPFPVIQIYLSDAYGKATAMRRFRPKAYLHPSVDIRQGLEPNIPINLILELRKPEKEVSAFQIDFL